MKNKLALLLTAVVGFSIVTVAFAQEAMNAESNTEVNSEAAEIAPAVNSDIAPAVNTEVAVNSAASSAPSAY